MHNKRLPLDPRENDCNYRHPGKHSEFDIFSYGADNKGGGSGDETGIVSW
ncbi:MAG: type II secretion system protein GspG [Hyphomicrobiaceae bacterium]